MLGRSSLPVRDDLELHAALEAARADAHERDAVAVRRVHVGLDLEDHAGELLLVGLDHALDRGAVARRRRQVDQRVEHLAHAEVVDRRAEEHRRLLAGEKCAARRTRGAAPRTARSRPARLHVLRRRSARRTPDCRGPRGSRRRPVAVLARHEHAHLLLAQVHHAVEALAHADRPGERHGLHAELALDLVHQLQRLLQTVPLVLMDEIERELGMEVVPFTWPVGMGKHFHGVMDLREKQMRVFKAGQDRDRDDDEILAGLDNPAYAERFGEQYVQAEGEIELLTDAAPPFERGAFLAGRQTPMFFGSAVNNFGVREVLDALVDLAPPPGDRVADPAHRRARRAEVQRRRLQDPGQHGPGAPRPDRLRARRLGPLRARHAAEGRRARARSCGPNTVVSFLSQRRELLDEAFAGDIIGIPNHGVLQLGDTLTEGEALQFTGLPFFAPEMFRSVEVADPLRTKQLRAGLTQLGEEGAIQVFRPVAGSVLLLGAVGQLQFEVVAHRLEHEYGVKARILPSRFQVARWVTCERRGRRRQGAAALHRRQPHRVAYDAVDAPTVLVEYAPELRAIEANWPKIRFHALREHAGLVFQKQLDG